MPNDGIVHVIDDDEAMRDSLAFLFKSAKVGVITYESADAFLVRRPDLNSGCIVTDVRMPGTSGLDLLKRLRELKSQIPVIVITGHGDVPLAVEAMKFGASDFFEKPFDDDLLLSSVRRIHAVSGISWRLGSRRSSYLEQTAMGSCTFQSNQSHRTRTRPFIVFAKDA